MAVPRKSPGTTADSIDIRSFRGGKYTESRATFKNDNDVIAPTAPPNSLTGVTYKGKFFALFVRGLLEKISIYCKRTGSGTITLAYSPQPGMGEIGTVTVTPKEDWDWQSATIGKFWNFEPIFIWVKTCSADVSFGFDEEGPPDAENSADEGATWTSEKRRYYIRVDMACQAYLPLPISGTVNTIAVPTTVSALLHTTYLAANGGSAMELTWEGPGTLTALQMAFKQTSGTVTSADMEIKFKIDDYSVTDTVEALLRAVANQVNTSSPLSFGVIDDVNHIYMFAFNFSLKFKRKCTITMTNKAAIGNKVDLTMFYAVEKL